ncbi:MAG: type III pantothenate kinase [Nitrospirales bacterium]|nr:type III pantothenate kinase [Nitrospirales bacterium]
MLLCIDIGNTTIGVGIFRDPLHNKDFSLTKVPTHPVRTAAEYREVFAGIIASRRPRRGEEIEAIISSVVPQATTPVQKALREISGRKPLIADHQSPSGLSFPVEHPERIGSDRIANAAAGYSMTGRATAVADCGTATTITVVDGKGCFRGGAILPGIGLMHDALHTRTAKLPRLDAGTPIRITGIDTGSAMASGIVFGTACAVDSLVQGMEKELGFKVQLVLTGGYSKLIQPLTTQEKGHLPLKKLKDCIVMPHLTFEGLRVIYQYYIL